MDAFAPQGATGVDMYKRGRERHDEEALRLNDDASKMAPLWLTVATPSMIFRAV